MYVGMTLSSLILISYFIPVFLTTWSCCIPISCVSCRVIFAVQTFCPERVQFVFLLAGKGTADDSRRFLILQTLAPSFRLKIDGQNGWSKICAPMSDEERQ
jgi:hypothetical protein